MFHVIPSCAHDPFISWYLIRENPQAENFKRPCAHEIGCGHSVHEIRGVAVIVLDTIYASAVPFESRRSHFVQKVLGRVAVPDLCRPHRAYDRTSAATVHFNVTVTHHEYGPTPGEIAAHCQRSSDHQDAASAAIPS